MKFEKLVMSIAVLFLAVGIASAQDKFLRAVESFSNKKPIYITLKNGDVVEGHSPRLSRKKGQIKEIKMKKKDSNDKISFAAEEIKEMYLPQSGWDKLAKDLDVLNAPRDWQKDKDNELNSELIRDGYAYFEQVETQISKKKKMTLLMQLVNPSFENKVRVYFDPFAAETASVGIAGVKLAGGIDKSYFVKKGNDVAFRLKKKNYKDEAGKLFGKCKAIKGLTDRWSDFEEATYKHATKCN